MWTVFKIGFKDLGLGEPIDCLEECFILFFVDVELDVA
jgi:hypothetical protein